MSRRDTGWRRDDTDRLIRQWKPGAPVPPGGWLREIREALGIPSRYLARRMQCGAATISKMERSEAKGSIRLATLRKAAEKMGCELSYIIAPPQGGRLTEVMREAAMRAATLPAISMLYRGGLRKYAGGPLAHEYIARYAAKMKEEEIWDDTFGDAMVQAVWNTMPQPRPKPPPIDTSGESAAQTAPAAATAENNASIRKLIKKNMGKGMRWPVYEVPTEAAIEDIKKLLDDLAAIKTAGLDGCPACASGSAAAGTAGRGSANTRAAETGAAGRAEVEAVVSGIFYSLPQGGEGKEKGRFQRTGPSSLELYSILGRVFLFRRGFRGC